MARLQSRLACSVPETKGHGRVGPSLATGSEPSQRRLLTKNGQRHYTTMQRYRASRVS